jgi:hypothetical protein
MRRDLAPFLRSLPVRERWGRWQRIWSIDDAPLNAGCYALVASESAIYIGQSGNIRSRLVAHHWRIKRRGVKTRWGFIDGGIVKVRISKRPAEHLMIEARLIERLSPKFNKRMVGRQLREPEGVFTEPLLVAPIESKGGLISLAEAARYLGQFTEWTRRFCRPYLVEAISREDIERAIEGHTRTMRRNIIQYYSAQPTVDYQI